MHTEAAAAAAVGQRVQVMNCDSLVSLTHKFQWSAHGSISGERALGIHTLAHKPAAAAARDASSTCER